MRLPLLLAALLALLDFSVVPAPAADVPEPSPYPVAWEFTFDYKKPTRIVVNVPGSATPRAYWYLPYTLTNEGDDTQVFVPDFQILMESGKVFRARKDVPKQVFDAIKGRERNKFMVPQTKAGGELRPGVDQARDSVAIWEEPEKDMGTFRIFVGGLSGEFIELKDEDSGQILKDAKGEAVILRKTLQLTYSTNGDEVYPGEDVLAEGENRIGKNAKSWVMR